MILYPQGFSLEAYKVTLTHARFYSSLRVSVVRTLLGTLLGVALFQRVGLWDLQTLFTGKKMADIIPGFYHAF